MCSMIHKDEQKSLLRCDTPLRLGVPWLDLLQRGRTAGDRALANSSAHSRGQDQLAAGWCDRDDRPVFTSSFREAWEAML